MKMRLGYIVAAKKELVEKLRRDSTDLHEYFSENRILATEEHDYEESFEGWKRAIEDCAKSTFIKETVYALDFKEDELKETFGKFKSDLELFDRWWALKESDCEIIPTTWLNT